MNKLFFTNLLPLLAICLNIDLIDSIDICDIVQINGTYSDIQMYRHWQMDGNVLKYRYKMYTKTRIKTVKQEWSFNIVVNHQSDLRVVIEQSGPSALNQSIQTFDYFIVNKFSGILANSNPNEAFNCQLNPNAVPGKIDCLIGNHKYYKSNGLVDYFGVMFSPIVADKDHPNPFVIVLNTKNSLIQILQVIDYHPGQDLVKLYNQVPEFVRQIGDPSPLNQLEGIVDYQVDQYKGHLLWFNIDGKPMYCFTPEGKPLSEQCKSVNNMINGFDSCFPVRPKGSDKLLIVSVMIIALIVIIIIAILVFLWHSNQLILTEPTTDRSSRATKTDDSTVSTKRLHHPSQTPTTLSGAMGPSRATTPSKSSIKSKV